MQRFSCLAPKEQGGYQIYIGNILEIQNFV